MPENEKTATTSQAAEKPRRSRPHKTEGAKRRTRRTAKKAPARAQKPRTQKSNLLFALDIGTRSVILSFSNEITNISRRSPATSCSSMETIRPTPWVG